jgi:hypothetical protein
MTSSDRLALQQPVTAGVIGRLEDAIAGLNIPVLVGDSQKPDGAGWQGPAGDSEFWPYIVVHDLRSLFDGPMNGPEEDGETSIQTTCVGCVPSQARRVADRVRDALLTQAITVDGRRVTRVRPDGGHGVERDDAVTPPLFCAAPRFTISTTPQ